MFTRVSGALFFGVAMESLVRDEEVWPANLE